MIYLAMIAFNIAMFLYQNKKAKQKRTTITALEIDPSQQPLADEVSNFQLMYGINEVIGSNCTWYGDYSTFKIYTKVKTASLFGSSSQKVEAANGYRIGFVLSLGYGEQRLYGMKVDDKILYQNNNDEGSYSATINKPDFFGSYQSEGGLVGNFRFYTGNATQPVDTYLQSKIGEAIPNYFHEAYVVFENFYIGNQNSLKPMTLITGRYPKISFLDNAKINIDKACNPMNVICDLLIKPQLGLNISLDKIDISSFIYAQDVLYKERFGMSFIKFEDTTTKEIIDDVNKVVDGQIRTERSSGKLQYKLNRQDYVLADLITLDETNIISVTTFSTNASSESVVEYKVTYTNVAEGFKQKTVTFHNDGKYSETRQPVSKAADYPSVNTEEIAQMIAKRDALPLTQQYRKMEVKLADIDININVGDVVGVKLDKYKIKRMGMRITSIDWGDSSDSTISLKLMQEIFAPASYYVSQSGSSWQDIDFTAKNVDLQLMEAPYQFTSDASISSNKAEIMTFAKNTTSTMTDYTIFNESNAVLDASSGFTPMTNLFSAIGRYDNIIVLATDNTLSSLANETENNVRKGFNMALITEGNKSEFISFTTISASILSNVRRGLLDSIPQSFTTAAQIKFFSYGFAITENTSYTAGTVASIKAQTRTAKNELDLASATLKTLTVGSRAAAPIVCNNLKINNINFNDTVSIGLSDLVTVSFSFRRKQKSFIQYYNEIETNNYDNVTHRLSFYNPTTNALIKTVDITNSTYTFSDESSLNGGVLYNSMRLEVKALSGGLESINKYTIIINRA